MPLGPAEQTRLLYPAGRGKLLNSKEETRRSEMCQTLISPREDITLYGRKVCRSMSAPLGISARSELQRQLPKSRVKPKGLIERSSKAEAFCITHWRTLQYHVMQCNVSCNARSHRFAQGARGTLKIHLNS